jgi:FKBP-type peptidyl-prolyl cis-trans isomerase
MPRYNLRYAALLVSLLVTAGCNSFCYRVHYHTAETGGIPAPADVAAPPADAIRTPTGLASKVLRPGTGTRHPRPNSEVTVHYTGWTTDGKMFDSSLTRGEPATFNLSGVIRGWTEGVQMMVVGEKRRFWIPEKLAYAGGGGPQGTLVFDIELLQTN